jgi:hypothetical protein
MRTNEQQIRNGAVIWWPCILWVHRKKKDGNRKRGKKTDYHVSDYWRCNREVICFLTHCYIYRWDCYNKRHKRSTREKLGFGLRALCLLDRYSATWATHPTPLLLYLFSGRDFHFCPGLDSDHDPPPTYGLPQSWDYRNVPPLLVGWEGVSLTIHQWLGALNCHPPNLYLLCSW